LSYLISAGSYIVFFIYTAGRFVNSSDQFLLFLLASATLFSGLGYLLANKQGLIPGKNHSIKIIAVLTVSIISLIGYNLFFVDYNYELSIEEEIELSEGENLVGEAEISKTGYLPIDINRERIETCIGTNESNHRLGGKTVGGYMTGFSPELDRENVSFNIGEDEFEQKDMLEIGNVHSVERIENCGGSELDEEVVGVASSEAFSYYY